MRITELLRLVWLNINQNKFKSVMTSIGIVVGAATIVMVIAIGRGGQMDVAEQFASLNAGSIDVSYEYEGEETTSGGNSFSLDNVGSMIMGGISNMFGGGRGGDSSGNTDSANSGGMAGGGNFSDNGGGMGGGFSSDDSSGTDGGGRSDMGNMENMADMAEAFANGDVDMSDLEDMFSGGEMPDGDAEDSAGSDAGDAAAGENEGSADGEGTDDAAGENAADGSLEGDESGLAEGETGNDSEDMSEAETAAAAEADEAEDETEAADLTDDRLNQENIILSIEDVEDIETFVSGLDGATISYTSRTSVEGGDLTEAETYTVAGVYYSYYTVSNLEMAEGEFLTDDDSDNASRVCVLGSSVAKELFESAADAYGETLYLDDRAYTVIGVLASSSTVSANITPDESIFVPYATGIKYITGTDISPVITVIAEDVNAVDSVIEDVGIVLEENYSNAEFTFSDASSKLEAAESSNEILTMLLTAMAVIVFI
ncbi:MAG: ABC transporter permease, partial [Clostridiales bacterium]|nr:ABC transporter permease [Clostridiales bacterium]